jgi:hypothetical protein
VAEVADHAVDARFAGQLVEGLADRAVAAVVADPADHGVKGLPCRGERSVEQIALVARVGEVEDLRQRELRIVVAEAVALLGQRRAELAGERVRVVGARAGGHRGLAAVHAVEHAIEQIAAQLRHRIERGLRAAGVEHCGLLGERAIHQTVAPARIDADRPGADGGRLDERQSRDVVDRQRGRELLVHDRAHAAVGRRDLRSRRLRRIGRALGGRAFGEQPECSFAERRDADVAIDRRHDGADQLARRKVDEGVLAFFVVGGAVAAAQLQQQRAAIALARHNRHHAAGGIGEGFAAADQGAVGVAHGDARVAELAEVAAGTDATIAVGTGADAAIATGRGLELPIQRLLEADARCRRETGVHAFGPLLSRRGRVATATATRQHAHHRRAAQECARANCSETLHGNVGQLHAVTPSLGRVRLACRAGVPS